MLGPAQLIIHTDGKIGMACCNFYWSIIHFIIRQQGSRFMRDMLVSFRLRCPIANDCTSTTSIFRHVAVAALATTNTSSATTKCRLLLGILMRITPDGIRTQKKTKETIEEIDADDYTILNENEATRLQTICQSTSHDINLASNDITLLSD